MSVMEAPLRLSVPDRPPYMSKTGAPPGQSEAATPSKSTVKEISLETIGSSSRKKIKINTMVFLLDLSSDESELLKTVMLGF